MSKLIYITESQLNEIIGNGAYFDKQDTTNEYRLGGPEISVGGVTGNYTDGDVEHAEPVITDKFAKQITKPSNVCVSCQYYGFCISRKPVSVFAFCNLIDYYFSFIFTCI